MKHITRYLEEKVLEILSPDSRFQGSLIEVNEKRNIISKDEPFLSKYSAQ